MSKSRGEDGFVNLPPFAVKLYDSLMQNSAAKMQYREIAEIIEKTSFAGSYTIEEITIFNLPVWVRIGLKKRTQHRMAL